MYLVKFICKSGSPDEVYCYLCKEDAINHMELFGDDDSGLYERIELLVVKGNMEMLLKSIVF